jgi:hypothetical protein
MHTYREENHESESWYLAFNTLYDYCEQLVEASNAVTDCISAYLNRNRSIHALRVVAQEVRVYVYVCTYACMYMYVYMYLYA